MVWGLLLAAESLFFSSLFSFEDAVFVVFARFAKGIGTVVILKRWDFRLSGCGRQYKLSEIQIV